MIVDIVSGFLGAGKTTLIEKILRESQDHSRTVILENEFGETAIDSRLLAENGRSVRTLSAGCICCSLAGDFSEVLLRAASEGTERMIIEPSGVGLLSDVLAVCREASLRGDILTGRVITVVDAEHCAMYLENFGAFYEDQIRHGDIIVMSRTAQCLPEQLQDCVETVHRLNPEALRVTGPWEAFSAGSLFLPLQAPGKEQACSHTHACHCHEGAAEHDHGGPDFEVWEATGTAPWHVAAVRSMFEALGTGAFGRVLRGKALFADTAGVWHRVDLAGGKVSRQPYRGDTGNRICVIGTGLCQEALTQQFEAGVEGAQS